jgi:hypothetical protein
MMAGGVEVVLGEDHVLAHVRVLMSTAPVAWGIFLDLLFSDCKQKGHGFKQVILVWASHM